MLGLNLALTASQVQSTGEARRHTVFGTVHQHALRTEAFTVLKADLLEAGVIEQVLETTQPDWVIHSAALADLDACEADPDLARRMNTDVPTLLARLCREHKSLVGKGGARLVYISTDAVFDGERGFYAEEDAPNPLSVYASTKLAGERAVAEANPDAIIARVNFYGWSLSGQRSLAEFFINSLKAGRPVMGFTDVYFCPLMVNDLARILLAMLEKRLSGLYHVFSRDSLSKYDFGVLLARRFGLDADLIQPMVVDQAGLKVPRSRRLILHTKKLSTALGRPLPTISAGIKRFYRLYQQGYPQEVQGVGDPR